MQFLRHLDINLKPSFRGKNYILREFISHALFKRFDQTFLKYDLYM